MEPNKTSLYCLVIWDHGMFVVYIKKESSVNGSTSFKTIDEQLEQNRRCYLINAGYASLPFSPFKIKKVNTKQEHVCMVWLR